ncbi:MAG: hypothetical protein A3J40_00075 [Erythrobacter sp. RIFCSPHIGHO2_12_FULL_63_10]|nr:MAG: hypothetical protein A3J40_00075 [Erythrobacter sp. RIFCSPHIGHO2_12_FULL_63_10]
MAPAIWRACESPWVVVFECSADAQRKVQPGFDLVNLDIIAEFSNDNGRHLVVADRLARHRLVIGKKSTRCDPRYLIFPDEHLETRLCALAALHYASGCRCGSQGSLSFMPTDYQRRRFVLLLRILDQMANPVRPPPTIRELALQVVYPHSQAGRSIEWKSSSERRHTQRLVSEARYMARTGYRQLLRARRIRA